MAAAIVAAASGAGCRRTSTQLVVQLTSDLRIPAQMDRVTLSVTGTMAPTSYTIPLAGTGAQSLPLRLTLVPGNDSFRGPVTVVGTALLGTAAVVSQTVRASFVPGEARTVSIALVARCTSVSCMTGQTCGADGLCRSVDVNPGDLVPFNPPDGGNTVPVPDGGCRAGATEACNGLDDNCNGMIDEGFDFQTDANNCGGCGVVCSMPHQPGVCMQGRCMLQACETGYGDCDTAAPGCETQLNSDAHCGTCTNDCAMSHPGTHSSWRCDATGAAPACVLRACDTNFGNCNMMDSDGCEQSLTQTTNCGACRTDCTTMFGGAPAACMTLMSGPMCQRTGCPAGTQDCDSNHADCETSITTVSNCGGCGVRCSFANAATACTSMMCAMGACNAGFADCDTMPSTGCEVQLAGTDAAHCGSCTHACSGSATCTGGVCSNEVINEIASGATHTCVRTTANNILCWGANNFSQSSFAAASPAVAAPDPARPAYMNASSSALGTLFLAQDASCVLDGTGAMRCVGSNTSGRLGVGNTSDTAVALTAIPQPYTGGVSWRMVSLGSQHGCGVTSSNALHCWGTNGLGQLGTGAAEAASTTRRAPTMGTAVTATGGHTSWLSVTSGSNHACALATDRTVWCWGASTAGVGQLGVDPAVVTFSTSTPRQVLLSGGAPVLADRIVAGSDTTCAAAARSIWCWGSNSMSALGRGAASAAPSWQASPVMGTLPSDVSRLAGSTNSFCAQLLDGSVWCWGANAGTQFGGGASPTPAPAALAGVSVANLGTVTALVSLGSTHGCYVADGARVFCAGANNVSQLGDGTTANRGTFGRVSRLPF